MFWRVAGDVEAIASSASEGILGFPESLREEELGWFETSTSSFELKWRAGRWG